jgi:NAD(P)-dependent dehydrogenase (short-subunit alcohol dehydrogenase family)
MAQFAIMKGKICLVTGANAGIGRETARGLAQKGATVILACRSLEKGEEAVKDIVATTGNQQVEAMALDLGRQADIRRFATAFLAKYDGLDVLVNNAGAFFGEFQKTEDGIERQLAVNHVGPFLLTHLLLPALQKANSARIVMVSSGAHYNGDINFVDLNGEKNYSPFAAYSQSKLGNVLFANEFARQFHTSGITANSLHPGVVRTHIGQKGGSWFHSLGWALMKPFMISATKGAATSLHVALAPELAGVTGKYFKNCKEQTPSTAAQDPLIAKRLWDATAALCGIAV